MSALTPAERELAALGAALAANCIPCVTFHVAAARKAGLSDEQIAEALAVAERVRQVPARAVLEAAARALPGAFDGAEQDPPAACCP